MLLGERYRLLTLAGCGGMAEVWRAEALGVAGFKRTVAIKRVLPHLRDAKSFRTMFIEEARVSAMLDHPNIVQVFDFGTFDEIGLFLAMEWVEGLSFRDLWELFVAQGRVLAPAVAAGIGVEVLHALANAHAHTTLREDGTRAPNPIIHRDVSPSNILVSVHGAVKLTDFGLARALDRAEMTPLGIVKGKLAYLPPELMQGARSNVHADLYATSVVLWEALAGRRLYAGMNDAQIVGSLLEDTPLPSVRDVRPDVPAALAAVVDLALDRDPASRYGSAEEMAAALSAAARALPEAGDARRIAREVETALEFRRLAPTPAPESSASAPKTPASAPKASASVPRPPSIAPGAPASKPPTSATKAPVGAPKAPVDLEGASRVGYLPIGKSDLIDLDALRPTEAAKVATPPRPPRPRKK